MTWQDLLDALNSIPEEHRGEPARFVQENVFDEEKDSDEYLDIEDRNKYADKFGEEIDNISIFQSDVDPNLKIYILTP